MKQLSSLLIISIALLMVIGCGSNHGKRKARLIEPKKKVLVTGTSSELDLLEVGDTIIVQYLSRSEVYSYEGSPFHFVGNDTITSYSDSSRSLFWNYYKAIITE